MHCGASPLPPAYNAEEINGIVSHDRKIPYDVHEIIARIADGSAFQEFKPEWGETLVCGTAKIHGPVQAESSALHLPC